MAITPGTAKRKHRASLISYLSDPENPWPTRGEMATTVLGFANVQNLYKHFSVSELAEIETECLEYRRQRYSRAFAEVDLAMISKAKDGDSSAAKLVYQRLENWNPATKVEGELNISIADLVSDLK